VDGACTITLVGVPLSLLLNVLLGAAYFRKRQQLELAQLRPEWPPTKGARDRGVS